jgi:uncharacterized protein
MADHPNAVRMRQAVESLMSGDLDGFLSAFSDDVVWRSGGSNQLSGTFRGKQGLAGWMGKQFELTDSTINVEPIDVIADDERLAIFLRIRAQRGDRSLDIKVANAHRVGPDGKFVESWYLPDDQQAWDRFYA